MVMYVLLAGQYFNMSVGNLHMLLSGPKAYPEYELLRSNTSVTEGSSFNITLNVSSKPEWANLDGIKHDYVIDGSGISSNDINGASLTGTFTLQNDQAALSITTSINDDTLLFVAGELPNGNQQIRKYRIDRHLTASFLESFGGPDGITTETWQSLFFKPDSTRMFFIDVNSERLRRTRGATDNPAPSADQWNILNTSDGAVDLFFQAGNVGSNREGLWISPNGTQLITISRAQKRIYHRQMSAWNPLTGTSAVGELDISTQSINPNGIAVKDDLSRGYVLDGNQRIYQYVGDANAAGGVSNWGLTHTVELGNLGPAPLPKDIAIDSNGELVYIADDFGGVFLYIMKIPWELSSLSYLRILDLSSSFSSVKGVYAVNPPSETLRLTVPALNLSTTVQINDNYNPPPAALGQSFEGGFYIGTTGTETNTNSYYLIMGPSSLDASCQWKTFENSSFSRCCQDGRSNTYLRLNDTNHPAGRFTATRSLEGFSDWYMPARNELNTIYLNRNDLPSGQAPTGRYWSSTESDAIAAYPFATACRQTLSTGLFGNGYKTFSERVRAVRRTPVRCCLPNP